MLDLLSGAHVTPTFTFLLVSVGLLVLAAIDIHTREVEDYATAMLLAVTTLSLLWEGVSAGQWASGLLSAAVAFLIYLALGMRGVLGGGDVKLSAVPALLLGAANPFLGVWWVAASLLIQHGFFLMARSPAGKAEPAQAETSALPHVPAMAAALLTAWTIFPT